MGSVRGGNRRPSLPRPLHGAGQQFVQTDFVLDAVEQPLYARRPERSCAPTIA